MKKLIFAITILMSLSVYADSEVALCEKEGLKFGDGSGRDSIPEECSEYFLSRVSPKLIKKSADEKFSVHAYRNIIFIKDPDSKIKGQNVIAGKYTELENIQAIAIDEVNKEIIVLEESGDILSFSSVITGNVAPKRVIKHKELVSVNEILVFEEEIIAFDDKNNEIHFFNRLGNIHLSEEKRKVSPLRTIRHVKGSELKLDKKTKELSVTDFETKTITSYSFLDKKVSRTMMKAPEASTQE